MKQVEMTLQLLGGLWLEQVQQLCYLCCVGYFLELLQQKLSSNSFAILFCKTASGLFLKFLWPKKVSELRSPSAEIVGHISARPRMQDTSLACEISFHQEYVQPVQICMGDT
jgi:hypothetical protein